MASTLLLIVATTTFICACNGFKHFQLEIPNGDNVEHPCKPNTQWMGVGHLQEQGGGPRNVFGEAFDQAGKKWTKALCQMDSDGDGQTNGAELGDPNCVWTKGATPFRTTALTHPGFKTPAGSFKYDPTDKTTLSCSGLNPSCPGKNEVGVKTLDLTMANNTKVPSQTTTYFCTAFTVPDDQVYHAVGFDAILDNLNVIHHMLLYGCQSSTVTKPGECDMSGSGCRDLLAIWSLGFLDTCLPDIAGVRFGKGTYRTFQLQVHWNNPLHRTDYTDSSGLRMHYTSTLRKYDMGIMWLGQHKLEIPGGAQKTYIGECSGKCTQNILLQPVTVAASTSHMHLIGKATKISHTVEATNVTTDILSQDVYDYDSPTWTFHDPPVVITPGDSLSINCTYDASSRNFTTRYGDATNDEMCFGFLQYYPKGGDFKCMQYDSYDICLENSVVCGNKCSLSVYLDNVTSLLSQAEKYCNTTSCNPHCLEAIKTLFQVYNNPCVKTRHPIAYRTLKQAFKTKETELYTAIYVCRYFHGQDILDEPLPQRTFNTSAEISVSCPSNEGLERFPPGSRPPQVGTTLPGGSATRFALSAGLCPLLLAVYAVFC
eukprot:scpid51565/ scgid9140/ Dopamine beta-hydroxylase; Dopamine beta-monooxygenase; Soluble dopamine beta-hydroxylase